MVEGARSDTGADVSVVITASDAEGVRAAASSMGILVSEIKELPPDPLEELASAVVQPKPVPAAPIAPSSTLPYTSKIPPKVPPNFVRKYMQIVGLRSFIFQSILAGWTAFMLFLAMAVPMSHAGGYSRQSQSQQEETAAALGTGFCCLFGGWSIVGLPLGIFAIATLRSRY